MLLIQGFSKPVFWLISFKSQNWDYFYYILELLDIRY